MLAKAIRSFSTNRKASLNNNILASLKFPAGTVAGHYKAAVSLNSERDIARFDN
jgi:hypothetical protein